MTEIANPQEALDLVKPVAPPPATGVPATEAEIPCPLEEIIAAPAAETAMAGCSKAPELLPSPEVAEDMNS